MPETLRSSKIEGVVDVDLDASRRRPVPRLRPRLNPMAKNTKSTRPRKRGRRQQKERVHSGPPSRRSRAMSLRVPVELLEALCHVAQPLGEATMKHLPNAGPLKYYGRKQGARSRGFNQLFKQFTLEAIESQIQHRVHVALHALHTDAVSRDHKAHIRQYVVFNATTDTSALRWRA